MMPPSAHPPAQDNPEVPLPLTGGLVPPRLGGLHRSDAVGIRRSQIFLLEPPSLGAAAGPLPPPPPTLPTAGLPGPGCLLAPGLHSRCKSVSLDNTPVSLSGDSRDDDKCQGGHSGDSSTQSSSLTPRPQGQGQNRLEWERMVDKCPPACSYVLSLCVLGHGTFQKSRLSFSLVKELGIIGPIPWPEGRDRGEVESPACACAGPAPSCGHSWG